MDVREKVVTNSKIKAFKFDRPVSSFWENSSEHIVNFYLAHDVLF
jgi:hypothetical protein